MCGLSGSPAASLRSQQGSEMGSGEQGNSHLKSCSLCACPEAGGDARSGPVGRGASGLMGCGLIP